MVITGMQMRLVQYAELGRCRVTIVAMNVKLPSPRKHIAPEELERLNTDASA